MLSSFSYFKDEKTKDDNFSSSKHDIMYVIHRMREICRQKHEKFAREHCAINVLTFPYSENGLPSL